MRATGPILIVLGLVCACWALFSSISTTASARNLSVTIGFQSRKIAEHLPPEELARVFEKPIEGVPQDAWERRDWVAVTLGRGYVHALRDHASAHSQFLLLLGLACGAWGITETLVTRRRLRAPR